MGLKTIFQEGMKERKRRKSLSKVNNEFKEKEKVHAAQLTALGQKAWEAKTDISAFADLQAAARRNAKRSWTTCEPRRSNSRSRSKKAKRKKSRRTTAWAPAQKEWKKRSARRTAA